MRYTEAQVASMVAKVKTLPADERVELDTLFTSLDLLRRHGDFTTPTVLERHYGLVVAPKTCQGLHGACRFKPNHDGDCDAVF